FGYKARQWFHTGCMRPLTQRRSRAKRQARWGNLLFPRPLILPNALNAVFRTMTMMVATGMAGRRRRIGRRFTKRHHNEKENKYNQCNQKYDDEFPHT
ncbi:MAG: hypothetical protein U9Q05_14605, partial [Thermodesulfobacteriota bacterium]|nr:hypothetical protein [Thermodesulfobacteriota bacterium]